MAGEPDIKTLMTIGENVVIEFKRAGNGPEHDTYETICAFLNRQGGDILLGVEDDGTVVGRADELGSGVRNLYYYVKLYSGAEPIFDEEDVFRLTVPLTADFSPEKSTTRKTTKKTTKKESDRPSTTEAVVECIKRAIADNPRVSLEEMAVKLNMTKDGVYYHITQLRNARKLKRVGGRKEGYWQFL